MNVWSLKKEICEVGRRLYQLRFVAASDGNISARVGPNEFLCTPTMVSKGYMQPADIATVDINGKQLTGPKPRTSEILLHLELYKANPDIQAVVHSHPPHATAFAVAGRPIPNCVLPEIEVFLGKVPTAVYETPGTKKFAETILPFAKSANTVLLANHGTITWDSTLELAHFHTETVDHYCRILLLSMQMGKVNTMRDQHVKELLEIKQRMGIDDPRLDDLENCDLCANEQWGRGFDESRTTTDQPSPASAGEITQETLVQTITDQVMAAIGK